MQTAVATVGTPLVTIVALAQYHDALAEHTSVGIMPADEGLKEYVVFYLTHNICCFQNECLFIHSAKGIGYL